jgi:Putative addiction module component
MTNTVDLEVQLLELPPAERARVLFKAWESLADDPAVAADPDIDSAGIQRAMVRDREIENGKAIPIDDEEFRKRTGANG